MNNSVRPFAVFIKALSVFVLINVLYGLIQPPVADVSAYNSIFPGMKRMPFGISEDPFTVAMDDLDALFVSHEISAEKKPDEIRVALIGDSSVWGEGLFLSDTLSGQWNQLNPRCGGKTIKVYNLGYPHPSILKDLMFIEEAQERQPDAILWFVTLNTLMNQNRLNPFITANRARALQILNAYDFPYAPKKALSEMDEGFYQRTLLGQRSFLARWMKLQALGLIWSVTGKDRNDSPHQPAVISPDVKRDPGYRGMEPGSDLRASLLLGALEAGYDLAGETPLALVNEPIFVASGQNSAIRYNDLYPRWAYDQYRDIVAAHAQAASQTYLDLWDAVPPEFFFDPALYFNADGKRLLAERINPVLLSMVCN